MRKGSASLVVSLSTLLSLLALLATPITAAAADAGFTVGQKVEVSFLGKWVTGTVTSTDGTWPKIHFVDGNGHDHEQPVPPSRLRLIGGGAAPAVNAAGHRPAGGAAPATAPGVVAPPVGPSAPASPGVVITQGDISASVDLTPAAGAAAPGQLPADPVLWPKAPLDKPIALKAAGPDEFFEKMGALLFADKVPQALVTYVNAAPGKDASWRIERADLSAGLSLGVSAPVAGDLHALALSPDGARFFSIAREGRVGVNENAQIWTIDPKAPAAAPQLLLTWKPYAAEQSLDREITWAGFIDADRVLTASQGGSVVLWQIAAGKAHAVYSAKLALWSTPALSGGRKYLALPTAKTLFFLDPLTAKVLGRLETPSLSQASISFRPDGKQVAAVMPGQFMVWDLATGGQPVCDFSSTLNSSGSLAWASDGFVMLDARYLIDLTRDVVLWTYHLSNRHGAQLVGNSTGRLWYIAEPSAHARAGAARATGSPSPFLVSATLPEEAARKIAAGLKDQDISLLRPGSKVALSVNVDAPDDVKQKITSTLTAALITNGMTVDDSAPVKLEASTAAGDSQEITYRVGFQEEKVSVTGTIYRLAFTSDGQTAWERVSKTSPPMMVQIKAGETAQQAVDAARKPNYGFFLNAALPRIVPKPGQKNGFGESDLTATGPQPATPRTAKP
jgi:WD40 repeat protein